MGNRRRRDSSDPGAGIRALRLEQLFREELNSILDSELSDSRFCDPAALTNLVQEENT